MWDYIHAQSVAGGADGLQTLPGVPAALAGFVNGAGGFLTQLGIPAAVAATVVAVLVISFAATSLDTSLRIQRLVLAELGKSYGILIEGLRLLARAVFVVDKEGLIRYIEVVDELTNEPDYEAALEAVEDL